MNDHITTSGATGGSNKFGTIIAIFIVLGIVIAGVFYMLGLEEKSGVTQEAPVLEGGAVEEMIAEEGVGVEGSGVIAEEGNVVAIKDFQFIPATITIKTGDAVTWMNNETSVPHNIVLDDGSYKSAAVFAGESETRRFPVAGTYPYHCGIHPGMKGVVLVR